MFRDRKEAGKKLARALKKYRNKKVLVLAIPRGGIEIAYEVAKYLNAEFSLLISRKLPLPYNPEAGFGAIAEDGSTFIFDWAEKELTMPETERIEKEQKEEIKRRIKILREGKPIPKISDKIVILVDDGLAMGATMIAAIMLCRKKNARKIVVAVPVSGRDTANEMKKMADEIIILEKPEYFQAVAQVYEHWHDVSDAEVLKIMKKWKRGK
jgi:predicted phosphoribosyltransferase